MFEGLELCCPVCRGELRETGTGTRELVCQGCARVFPVVLGIPDLRIFADPYIDIEADRAKGGRIAERYADSDFAGLVDFYYSITDTVPPAQRRRFVDGVTNAPTRAAATLDAWLRLAGESPRGAFLEVGCGTAPLLIHAARRYERTIGVDIAFRWLIVARKRLEEAGVRATLVCACAEALPFREAGFDVAAAESALEVTREPARAAAEIFRALRGGGSWYIATPNRWSIGPDPHLGVPAGGWWPESWIDAWARSHKALPPLRHLLSANSLAAMLKETGFTGIRTGLPDIPPEQRQRMSPVAAALAGIYQGLKDAPLVHEALEALGPMLLATARRP